MSLYNLLFGQNTMAELLLSILDLEKGDVGRFRDAFVCDDPIHGKVIAIYTRNGGGNRENYQDTLDHLSTLPGWIRDEDDDFDETYCTIYFQIPETFKTLLSDMSVGGWNPDERWFGKLEEINKGEIPEKTRVIMQQLGNALKQALEDKDDGPKIITI